MRDRAAPMDDAGAMSIISAGLRPVSNSLGKQLNDASDLPVQ
jgi:hypothetical protein